MSDRKADEAFWNGASVSSGGTLTKTLNGHGSGDLAIQVKSDNTWSVDVKWQDGEGNTIRDETSVINAAANTWARSEVTAWSPHVVVEFNEDGGASSTVDGTIHFY